MKRLKIFILTVLISLSIFTVGFAADSKLTTEELFNKWTKEGYPDDVGGVYYDSDLDKLVFTLVNKTDARMDEIRSLVTDPENLAFDEWKYSYNDLLAVMKDIEREMWDQPNEPVIYGVGIGWTTIDGEVTGFGEGGKEFRVVVQVSENVFSELTEKYRDKYGDMVYVEGSQGIVPLDDAKQSTGYDPWILAIIILFCVAIFGIFILNRRGVIFSMQTADGDTVNATKPMGRKEVIAAVRESQLEPSDRVYKLIRERMEI